MHGEKRLCADFQRQTFFAGRELFIAMRLKCLWFPKCIKFAISAMPKGTRKF